MRGYDLDKVLKNVSNFREISTKPICIESVIARDNLKSVRNFPKVLNQIGATHFELRLLHAQIGDISDQAIYNEQEIDSLFDFIGKECNKYNIEFIKPDLKDTLNDICVSFFDMNVDYEGFVTSCYFLPRERFSKNLLTDSLEDVWNGKEIRQIRKAYLEDNMNEKCCCSMVLMKRGKV